MNRCHYCSKPAVVVVDGYPLCFEHRETFSAVPLPHHVFCDLVETWTEVDREDEDATIANEAISREFCSYSWLRDMSDQRVAAFELQKRGHVDSALYIADMPENTYARLYHVGYGSELDSR